MMNGYQVCANCVMDRTDPAITFDDTGVCDHCREFDASTLPNWRTDRVGREALDQTVSDITRAGKGRSFDCIIGLSGGIDSSYLTYLAKVELGLRPLVFHVDAGWNSQEAVNNIEALVDGLGLDLYTEVIDWEEMRDLQLAFFRSGVPHLDIPQDHAFFATMYDFSAKYGVKHILTGANYSTECVRNPLEWIYYGTDVRQINDIHAKFGTRPLKTFPLSNILRHKVYLRYIRGLKVVTPLNFLPYTKQDAIELLADKFGWQSYPHKHYESRFTRFYEGYWLPQRFGFDTRRVQFSSLILTKQMTRADALAALSKPAYDADTIARDFEYIATKLQISVAELEGLFRAPKRSYRDYKNQQYLFHVGARVMKALGLERAIKR